MSYGQKKYQTPVLLHKKLGNNYVVESKERQNIRKQIKNEMKDIINQSIEEKIQLQNNINESMDNTVLAKQLQMEIEIQRLRDTVEELRSQALTSRQTNSGVDSYVSIPLEDIPKSQTLPSIGGTPHVNNRIPSVDYEDTIANAVAASAAVDCEDNAHSKEYSNEKLAVLLGLPKEQVETLHSQQIPKQQNSAKSQDQLRRPESPSAPQSTNTSRKTTPVRAASRRGSIMNMIGSAKRLISSPRSLPSANNSKLTSPSIPETNRNFRETPATAPAAEVAAGVPLSGGVDDIPPVKGSIADENDPDDDYPTSHRQVKTAPLTESAKMVASPLLPMISDSQELRQSNYSSNNNNSYSSNDRNNIQNFEDQPRNSSAVETPQVQWQGEADVPSQNKQIKEEFIDRVHYWLEFAENAAAENQIKYRSHKLLDRNSRTGGTKAVQSNNKIIHKKIHNSNNNQDYKYSSRNKYDNNNNDTTVNTPGLFVLSTAPNLNVSNLLNESIMDSTSSNNHDNNNSSPTVPIRAEPSIEDQIYRFAEIRALFQMPTNITDDESLLLHTIADQNHRKQSPLPQYNNNDLFFNEIQEEKRLKEIDRHKARLEKARNPPRRFPMEVPPSPVAPKSRKSPRAKIHRVRYPEYSEKNDYYRLSNPVDSTPVTNDATTTDDINIDNNNDNNNNNTDALNIPVSNNSNNNSAQPSPVIKIDSKLKIDITDSNGVEEAKKEASTDNPPAELSVNEFKASTERMNKRINTLVKSAVKDELVNDMSSQHFTKRAQNILIAKSKKPLVKKIEKKLETELAVLRKELVKLRASKLNVVPESQRRKRGVSNNSNENSDEESDEDNNDNNNDTTDNSNKNTDNNNNDNEWYKNEMAANGDSNILRNTLSKKPSKNFNHDLKRSVESVLAKHTKGMTNDEKGKFLGIPNQNNSDTITNDNMDASDVANENILAIQSNSNVENSINNKDFGELESVVNDALKDAGIKAPVEETEEKEPPIKKQLSKAERMLGMMSGEPDLPIVKDEPSKKWGGIGSLFGGKNSGNKPTGKARRPSTLAPIAGSDDDDSKSVDSRTSKGSKGSKRKIRTPKRGNSTHHTGSSQLGSFAAPTAASFAHQQSMRPSSTQIVNNNTTEIQRLETDLSEAMDNLAIALELKSTIKKELKDWEKNFLRRVGRPPNDADKSAVEEKFLAYRAAAVKVKEEHKIVEALDFRLNALRA